MRIISFKYSEFMDDEQQWTLENVELGKINLLVGRNATGKSRVINIIANLAKLVSGKLKEVFVDGSYDIVLEEGSKTYHYVRTHQNFNVIRESLSISQFEYLHRGGGGIGRIRAEELDRLIKFQISGRELAVVAKRDSIQHPGLQPLNEWGNAARHFEFGKGLGHPNLAIAVKSDADLIDVSDTTQIVGIVYKGMQVFKDAYIDAIKADMERIGFPLENINIRRPIHLRVLQAPVYAQDLVGVCVKEKDLSCWTDQPAMSQGMFRALSVIAQLNYSICTRNTSLILIDDIGEGLDYERSCALIELLREKTMFSQIQLIMSTNDRFVMNAVPLEEWCVLSRTGSSVKVYNYCNSAEIFERFKRTGLSNFDFLTTDFVEQVH